MTTHKTVSPDGQARCEATGSTIFGSRKKALKSLASMQRSAGKYGQQRGVSLAKTAVRCKECGGWHWSRSS